VLVSPTSAKAKYIATPAITDGTTSGNDNAANGNRGTRPPHRNNPNAASVPSRLASTAVCSPTTTLLRVAVSQRPEVKKSSYHRSDSPGIGSVSTSPDENDNGTTTSIGVTRNNSTSAV